MLFQPNAIVEGKYRVRRFLGQGGSAEVYLVTHLALSTDRAIKVISKEIDGVGSSTFGDYRRRFAQEAKLGAGLDHPNLIRVHDFIERSELAVLEMEYAPGGSLAELISTAKLRSEPVELLRCMAIAKDMAAGLARLHSADFVHRDLKPANVLLDASGRAKVSDLGLAQTPWGDSARSFYGPEGARPQPGTPAYMSPEQERQTSHLRPSADVYAWAATLFELLTLRQVRNVPPGTRAASLRADVPPWLDDLLARCLANAPEERPWDGAALGAALVEGDAGAVARESKAGDAEPRRKAGEGGGGTRRATGGAGTVPAPPRPVSFWPRVVLVIGLLSTCGVIGMGQLGPGPKGLTATGLTETPTATGGPTATGLTATVTATVPEDPTSQGKGLQSNGLPDIAWVEVPAGPFIMGSDDHDDEKPQRTINLPAFKISKYETTNAHYQAFVTASDGYRNDQWWNQPVKLAVRDTVAAEPQWRGTDLPADTASWYDAVAYTRWLTARLWASGDLDEGQEVRLPTEEEWEKAARGIDSREYPWGNGYEVGHANLNETLTNSGPAHLEQTVPVGSYPRGASPFGILDMAGNVWEWTLTEHGSRDSTDLSNDRPRVVRGGSWINDLSYARVAFRGYGTPDDRGIDSADVGFRVVAAEIIH